MFAQAELSVITGTNEFSLQIDPFVTAGSVVLIFPNHPFRPTADTRSGHAAESSVPIRAARRTHPRCSTTQPVLPGYRRVVR